MIQNRIKKKHGSNEECQIQTWSAMLTRSIPLIYGIYARKGLHPALAEELTQKTVFDAVRGQTAFDPMKGSLEQWVLGIAHKNLAMEMRRRAGCTKAVETLSVCLNIMEKDLLPDELLERDETRQLVRQAMAALPDKERRVLELKYLQDLTAREIARDMKVTEKAVHSLLYRARIQLRDQLKHMEPLLQEEPKS